MMANTPDGNSSRQRISTGTRLNGIYEIDGLIGIGGMGEIYKGHAIETGDLVAIKLMLPELAENDAALALFRREASALHNLMHEAIVRYYVFTVEPVLRRPYLAMEFVNGRSVSDILEIDGPLPFEAVRSLMQRVASGLHAAHQRGIIHRDVSPDNIIVPDSDVARAKIIDFGIARSTQLSEGTVIGSGFAGKYNYVSPEQLGLFGGDVTAKSDIYSLGLVLVEALTGKPIDMGGSQVAVVEKRRKVPDLGAIDMRFRPLIEKMLQPDPANRPESMAVIAAWSLDAKSGSRRQRSPDARSTPSSADGKRGGRGRWIAAAAAVLVLIGAAAGYYYYATDGFGPATPDSKIASAPALNPANTPSPAPASPLSPAPSTSSPLSPSQPSLVPIPLPSSQPPASGPAAPPVAAPIPPANPPGPSTALTPGPRPTPATPTPARPSLPANLSPTEKIRQYVEQYDGGDCFFIMPVAIGEQRAAIEGFGAKVDPFNTLDEAFKRDIGFSADIGLRQVTQQQCPAITFLSRLRNDRARAPRLDVDKVHLRSGEVLSGTIERFGSRNVELLLVSDGGAVQNVSSLLKTGIDAKTFSIGVQHRGDTSGSLPQLLVAVATPQPLNALRQTQPVSAEQLFPAVLAEAARSNQALGVTAKYFRLER